MSEPPYHESAYNMAILQALVEIRNAILTLAVMTETGGGASPIEFFQALNEDGVATTIDAAISNLEVG